MISILDILFPKYCVGCAKVGNYLCNTCAQLLLVIPQHEMICPMCDRPSIDGFTHLHCIRPLGLDGLVSYFYYRGMGKKLIKEVKYRYSTDIVSVIRPYIEKSSPHLFSSISSEQTCVVPIPLHRTKYLYRGFNQSELFGTIISKHVHCSVDNTLLVKTKETLPQAFITEKTKRILNIRNVFTLTRICSYSCVLLVDDVFTTGATLKDACKVLKRSGVKKVFGVTIAR